MAIACIGVFFVGIGMQYLSNIRRVQIFSAPMAILLFGVHITLSYLVMLVAMSYNVELFCMVCAGLTVGFGVFNTTLIEGLREGLRTGLRGGLFKGLRGSPNDDGDLCCSASNESPLMNDSR